MLTFSVAGAPESAAGDQVNLSHDYESNLTCAYRKPTSGCVLDVLEDAYLDAGAFLVLDDEEQSGSFLIVYSSIIL